MWGGLGEGAENANPVHVYVRKRLQMKVKLTGVVTATVLKGSQGLIV